MYLDVCPPFTGKTPEEIRKTFNIKNDFTPEEEEQVCEFTANEVLRMYAYNMYMYMYTYPNPNM